MRFLKPLVCVVLMPVTMAWADGPKDNDAASVRRIPPLGIEVPAAEKQKLEAEIATLRQGLGQIKPGAPLSQYIPDVEVLIRAVSEPLKYQEIQKDTEIKQAYELLALARERLEQLSKGEAPWTRQTGLVLRGFRSKLDGTVQPYGLVIPGTYRFDGSKSHRLDFWFHGRGETLTELAFAQQRLHNLGEYTPKDTIVLHPYARYCNANHLAGEIDCLEALEHAKQDYRIDDNRVVVRGFSMGGAACWNFAVHYSDLFAAANPGAGFSETPEFLNFFQNETIKPTEYENKLMRMYNCTEYAINLFNLPTVAYSGEIDKQKQAADIMERYLKEEDLALTHVIGPQTAHKIHPDSKIEIERRLASILAAGRDPMPHRVRFTTFTLRYNRMYWLTVDGMDQHWERARLDADVTDPLRIDIRRVENVSAFTIDMPAGLCPLDPFGQPKIVIGSQELFGPKVGSDRSWKVSLYKEGAEWKTGTPAAGLAKRHGLQGPIDDAFLDSFLMVAPTGQPLNQSVGHFVKREMDHAVVHWRQQFRGDARVKKDTELTDQDIAAHNLILWGDPSSNQVLAKIADKLPVVWGKDAISVGKQQFPTRHYAPVLIYPNPLNPNRYVVLNSGVTYREYDYLNNARQVPKLPDWAVIDTDTPMTPRGPGQVAAAGFFGEQWELKAPSGG